MLDAVSSLGVSDNISQKTVLRDTLSARLKISGRQARRRQQDDPPVCLEKVLWHLDFFLVCRGENDRVAVRHVVKVTDPLFAMRGVEKDYLYNEGDRKRREQMEARRSEEGVIWLTRCTEGCPRSALCDVVSVYTGHEVPPVWSHTRR